MRSTARVVFVILCLALVGCSNEHLTKPPDPRPIPGPGLDVVERLVLSYEQKKASEYQGCFTGDFTYQFSSSTDPTLVQQYATGWFRADEIESSSHLFSGYTPPGQPTISPASTIEIKLAVMLPTDDNTAGLDPTTHKVLATPVDGTITVPDPAGGEPLTYVIANNFNVFYIVRGDVAVNLDSTQPADTQHWYIYRWVDLTASSAVQARATDGPVPTSPVTWGAIKGRYR